jgi:hypothetical protein
MIYLDGDDDDDDDGNHIRPSDLTKNTVFRRTHP